MGILFKKGLCGIATTNLLSPDGLLKYRSCCVMVSTSGRDLEEQVRILPALNLFSNVLIVVGCFNSTERNPKGDTLVFPLPLQA